MIRWLSVIGIVLVVLLGSAYAVLRVAFEGEGLADNISDLLNKRMRGRIVIKAIHWEPSALKTAVTGGWVPVELEGVTIWDDCALSANVAADFNDKARTGDPNEDCTPDEQPDPTGKRLPRKRLVTAPRITAEVDIHALMFGNHDFVFRNVWLHPGAEALIEQADEPYPLHAYDQTIVSIVTAFYPRQKPGFRAGIYADSPPPIFDVRDIHIEGLNLTVHMAPLPGDNGRIEYATTARLENVNVDSNRSALKNDSYLYMDASDPLVAKFYVRLGVRAERGVVRARDTGPRSAFRIPDSTARGAVYPPPGRTAEYTIGLTDIVVDRLAQLPTDWSRHDVVANTLELDLHARTLPCATPNGPPVDPAQGATLHFGGQLHDYWDRPYDGSWDLTLEAKNLGPTMKTCIDSRVSGTALDGTITLAGPFVALPAVSLDLKNLDVDVPLRADEPPLPLTLAEVHGKIDLVNEQGYIDQTKALVRGGKEPGEIDLSATFALDPYNANAHVEISKAIDMARFLPPKVVSAAGKFLHGKLSARGDVADGFSLEDFDLKLGPTPTSAAIRVHEGTLYTGDEFKSIEINHVRIEAGRTRAYVDGVIYPDDDQDSEIRIEGTAPDLGVWMDRFGIPGFLGLSAGGGSVIVIKGKLSNPTVNVATELGGVPCLDKVRIVNATVANGVADGKFQSAGLGGTIDGNVRVAIGTQKIEKLNVVGKRLDAAKFCGLAETVKVKGTLDHVEVAMSNTTIDPKRSALDWLSKVDAFATTSKLSVEGDRYTDIGLCLNHTNEKVCRPRGSQYLDHDDVQQCTQAQRGGFCLVATATREAGGRIDATVARIPATKSGKTTTPEQLAGTISVHDLPLSIIESFTGGDVVGGLASLTLHLEGSPKAPQAIGAIDLLRTWVMDEFTGDAQLAVEPAKMGNMPGLSVRGSALAGRVILAATIGTAEPYPVEVKVIARRLELDVLLDLQKRFDLPVLPGPVQGWVTGTITLKTELAPKVAQAPEAWVELSEAEVVYTHETTEGQLVPLRLRVLSPSDRSRETAVSLRVTPTTVELACKDPKAAGGRAPCSMRLGTPAGIVDVGGYATQSAVAITAGGDLDLSLIAPLVDRQFDALQGQARLDASIAGSFENPRYEAALELKNVVGRPFGGDTVLEAPTGLIKLANGSLGFTDVKIQVRDEHRDEAGELHVKGNIALDGFTPVGWGVLVSGKIAGKMLLVAAPEQISQASGLARIDGDLLLSGKEKYPVVSGSITFDSPPACEGSTLENEDGTECRPAGDSERHLSIIPRGVRRELSFTKGSFDIETIVSGQSQEFSLYLNGVEVTIDGEGRVHDIYGDIKLEDGVPTFVKTTLSATAIPFRIPGTLDVVLGATNVRIERVDGTTPPSVRGDISLDGTYRRNFNLTDTFVTAGSTTPPSRPFWETYPALGSADLRLDVAVTQFAVRNNIAELYFTAPLVAITGTPRSPQLDGVIDVSRGSFKIPGTRARFDQTRGNIQFSRNRPANNPTLAITSDSNFRDLSGQEHLISFELTGNLDQLQWDLRTAAGYNKSQTMSLLLLGRGPEALRRSLGDQSIGVDPTRGDPTTNPSQGIGDQIVKDLSGDWLSGVVASSVTKLTGLDVFRVQISTNSIGVHLEKNIFTNIKVIGDTERGTLGTTVNVRAEARIGERTTLEGGYLSKDFTEPAEQDIQDTGGKIRRTWNWFVP